MDGLIVRSDSPEIPSPFNDEYVNGEGVVECLVKEIGRFVGPLASSS